MGWDGWKAFAKKNKMEPVVTSPVVVDAVAVFGLHSSAWKCVEDANIQIGAGSYFSGDEEISCHFQDVTTVDGAWAKVSELAATNNPVVMWEITAGGMRAHRFSFLMQEQDDAPTNAALFAQHTAEFVRGRQKAMKRRVYVRIDSKGSIHPTFFADEAFQVFECQKGGGGQKAYDQIMAAPEGRRKTAFFQMNPGHRISLS
jgi:hypothetical protein